MIVIILGIAFTLYVLGQREETEDLEDTGMAYEGIHYLWKSM